jgi:hypothetical protein
VNKKLLSEAQAKVQRLPHAMYAYLAWLQPKMRSLKARLDASLPALRGRFLSQGMHARTPEALAHLAFEAELFGEFAADKGVFTEAERTSFIEDGIEALTSLGSDQVSTVGDADLGERFLSPLATLLCQGKVRLCKDRDVELTFGSGVEEGGWHLADQRRVLLLPDAAYRVVNASLRAAGQSVGASESGLWRHLNARGLLAERDGDRLTVKKTLGSRRVRVLVLESSNLGLEDDGGGGGGGSVGGADLGHSGQPGAEAGRQELAALTRNQEVTSSEAAYCPERPECPSLGDRCSEGSSSAAHTLRF